MRGLDERKNLLTGANGMKLRMAILCTAFSLAIAGCNTMEGMGTDIAKGGEKIQDASHKVRQDWREARDRHDREFQSARTSCASMAGAERDACIERAHERYSAQMSDARKTYPRQNRLAESDEDRAEDLYDVARERCEALRGDAEERCLADARARYRRR
jgi:predicted small secreted protein